MAIETDGTNGSLILLKQGAEARIFESAFVGRRSIIKERFSKKYRHPSLDLKLTLKRLNALLRISTRSSTSALNEALRLMNEALGLYEKGLHAARTRECMLELKELKSKTLRFISAVHLQMGEFESVIKCVKVLREGDNEDRHPSLPVLALKAWLGLRRFAEAEKELRGMVVNKGIPESVWVSSVEAYFQAAGTAGAETAKEVFLGLFISRSRRHQDPEPVDRFQRC